MIIKGLMYSVHALCSKEHGVIDDIGVERGEGEGGGSPHFQ